jgi:hypothetical protein
MQDRYKLKELNESQVARKDTILVTTIDGKPWRLEPGGPDYLCGLCDGIVIEGVPRNAALISGGILAVVCVKCGAKNVVPPVPGHPN